MREEWEEWERRFHSVNVTHSFDRTKKYYRVLRYNEKKYFSGKNHPSNYTEEYRENNLYWPIDLDENEGGFYFTKVECVFNYMFHWGDRICKVTVPDDAIVFKEDSKHHFGDDVWRASEIFLSEPLPLTVDVMKKIISEGGVLNNYNINMCIDGVTSRIIEENQKKSYKLHITKNEADKVVEFLDERIK